MKVKQKLASRIKTYFNKNMKNYFLRRLLLIARDCRV